MYILKTTSKDDKFEGNKDPHVNIATGELIMSKSIKISIYPQKAMKAKKDRQKEEDSTVITFVGMNRLIPDSSVLVFRTPTPPYDHSVAE
jgi:hypothetical protein